MKKCNILKFGRKTFCYKRKIYFKLMVSIFRKDKERQNVDYFGLLIFVDIKKSIQKLQIIRLKILLSLLIWKSCRFLISLQNFLGIYCS